MRKPQFSSSSLPAHDPVGYSAYGKASAIETNYKGYRMRSRLEARWAVYFDALGVYWEYEKEGFDLSGGRMLKGSLYLPDFWLPQVKKWAEVKPEIFDRIEVAKCQALANATGYACIMLEGQPELRPYWSREPEQCGFGTECDYLIDSSYLHENRFFASGGWDRGESIPDAFSIEAARAVLISRGARFEHGEKPVVPEVRRG